MTSSTQIEQIKEHLNIFDVVHQYVPNLRKSGNSYFGLCPFHSEKTPSFSINPDLGIFKCFGCGEGGDVLTFIQKIENVDFPEALKIAADQAGIKLDFSKFQDNPQITKDKETLYKLNYLVYQYYSYILNKHRLGKKGQEYLKKRHLSKTTVESFGIGFAPGGDQNLISFLKSRGFTDLQMLTKNGLTVHRENNYIDKFRNRLVFPIYNSRGDIIGFSGRIIFEDTKAPKYLNSPQTVVYNKSQALFGLLQAKESIRKQDFVIIVEGQIDALSSYQSGIKNIVAPLGTALTEDQLKLLKRYASSVYFCFDNDSAGEKALLRSALISLRLDIITNSITLPDGIKDVDELVVKDKPAWIDAVKNKQDVIINITNRISKRLDLTTPEGKSVLKTLVKPLIRSVKDAVKRAFYIHTLASALDVKDEILTEEFEKEKSEISFNITNSPVQYEFKNRIGFEEYLLVLILANTQFYKSISAKTKLKYLKSEAIITITTKLLKFLKRKKFSLKKFLGGLEKDEVDLLKNIILFNVKTYEAEQEFLNELNKVLKNIKEKYLKNQLSQIRKAQKSTDTSKDKREGDKLLKREHNILKMLK